MHNIWFSASWGQSAQIHTFKSLQTTGNVTLAYGSPQNFYRQWFLVSLRYHSLYSTMTRQTQIRGSFLYMHRLNVQGESRQVAELRQIGGRGAFWFRGIAGAPPATLAFLKILCKRISSIPESADARFTGLVNNECLAETVWHRGNRTFNFKLSEERSKSRGMFIFMRIWIFVK